MRAYNEFKNVVSSRLLYEQDDDAPDERIRHNEAGMSLEAAEEMDAAIAGGRDDQCLDEFLSACTLPEALQVLCYSFIDYRRPAQTQSEAHAIIRLVDTTRSGLN